MRASSARATHLLLPAVAAAALALANLPRLSEGFGSPTTSTTSTGPQRCRVPRMALTPPPKPNTAAAGGDENGKTSFGPDDMLTTSSRITRAPLRITPNFQPQEKRRPKTDERWDITHGAFLTEESFDIAGELVKRRRSSH